MNNEQFKNQWNQIKDKIKDKFNKLSDDDLRQIEGKRDQLLAKLQSRYGYEKSRAEDELSRFEKTCSSKETVGMGSSKGMGSSSMGSSSMGSRESNPKGRGEKNPHQKH